MVSELKEMEMVPPFLVHSFSFSFFLLTMQEKVFIRLNSSSSRPFNGWRAPSLFSFFHSRHLISCLCKFLIQPSFVGSEKKTFFFFLRKDTNDAKSLRLEK